MTNVSQTDTALHRQLVAEFLGTALLVAVVVGSGIAAASLSPTDTGIQLLENSLTTALALVVLILAFAPVSKAHFNPVVTLVSLLADRRDGVSTTPLPGAMCYLVAQCAGAIVGALLANAMFDVPTTIASNHRATGAHVMAEVVATAGLVLVIFTLTRTGRGALVAPAVGAFIGAAYWFTSSTSFANPAVTLGRMFSDTFAGIAPGSVPAFVGAQLVGGLIGLAVVLYLYPRPTASAPASARSADDVVVATALEEHGVAPDAVELRDP